jgi:hypothetical protein
MGPDAWNARRHYYDGLTIREDGDVLERMAARDYGFETSFPSYERFWKFNVVPSSPKPQGEIGFRPGSHTSVRHISQHSYSVLHNLVQAERFAEIVSSGAFGFLNVNIQCLTIFAGNALQLLAELQRTVEKELGPALTGNHLTVLPDWKTVWEPRRDRILNYRHYLTHRGLMITHCRSIDGVVVPHVLSPDALRARQPHPTAWAYADDGVDPDGPDWVPFPPAAISMLNDALAFCNDVYRRMCDTLEPHLPTEPYQTAWGWAAGLPVVP